MLCSDLHQAYVIEVQRHVQGQEGIGCITDVISEVLDDTETVLQRVAVNDTYAFCPLNEGLGGVLRFGKNTPDVIDKDLRIFMHIRIKPGMPDKVPNKC